MKKKKKKKKKKKRIKVYFPPLLSREKKELRALDENPVKKTFLVSREYENGMLLELIIIAAANCYRTTRYSCDDENL